MNCVRFETESEEETEALGHSLASALPRGSVVSLIGNLGAGKTTLTRGIVAGLGAAKAADVSSPTYTLIHEYGEPVQVYHVDLYRLENVDQVAGLGLDELFDSPALVLIEWGDRFQQLLPPTRIEIEITYQRDDRRFVEVRGCELPATFQPSRAQ